MHPLIHSPLDAGHDVAHHAGAIGQEDLGDVQGGLWSDAHVAASAGRAAPGGNARYVSAVPTVINITPPGETLAGRDAASKVGMVGINASVHDSDFDALTTVAPF